MDEDQTTEVHCLGLLKEALAAMHKAKPAERSELARRYAVSITEMEKVVAYFQTYVVGEAG